MIIKKENNNKKTKKNNYWLILVIVGILLIIFGIGYSFLKEKNEINISEKQEQILNKEINPNCGEFIKKDTNNNYLLTLSDGKIKDNDEDQFQIVFDTPDELKNINFETIKNEKIKSKYSESGYLISSALIPSFVKHDDKKFLFTKPAFEIYQKNIITLFDLVKKEKDLVNIYVNIKPYFENENDKMPILYHIYGNINYKDKTKNHKFNFVIKNSEKGLKINYKQGTAKK